MRTYLSCLLFAPVLIGVGSFAHADTLVLANGDKIEGEITEWAVDHVVIEHPQIGSMRFELDQLELDTGTPPNPGLFGTRFLRGWSRRIDLGINGEQDDSPTASVTLGSKFTYKDHWTRWVFNGRYFYNVSSGSDGDNDNNATADLSRHWLNPESRWFLALAGRYQFDQFQAWKHRISLFAGPGFHVLDGEKHTVDLEAGPGYTREFGTSNTNKAEAVLTLSYDWKISERQSFDFANQYFLQLAPNAGDWRNFTRTTWSVRLTERPALSLNIGLQNEYDSTPDEGDPTNDLKYFLTLGMNF